MPKFYLSISTNKNKASNEHRSIPRLYNNLSISSIGMYYSNSNQEQNQPNLFQALNWNTNHAQGSYSYTSIKFGLELNKAARTITILHYHNMESITVSQSRYAIALRWFSSWWWEEERWEKKMNNSKTNKSTTWFSLIKTGVQEIKGRELELWKSRWTKSMKTAL